jgi:hypothetical protein
MEINAKGFTQEYGYVGFGLCGVKRFSAPKIKL